MSNLKNIDLKAIAYKAMKNYGFKTGFPKAVMTQVNASDENTPKNAKNKVTDLRNLLWSSIDNADSMDLDQLEYCERGENDES